MDEQSPPPPPLPSSPSPERVGSSPDGSRSKETSTKEMEKRPNSSPPQSPRLPLGSATRSPSPARSFSANRPSADDDDYPNKRKENPCSALANRAMETRIIHRADGVYERRELGILEAIFLYRSESRGDDPAADSEGFCKYVNKRTSGNFTADALHQRSRRLKNRYQRILREMGENPRFSRSRDEEAFELSKKIWDDRTDSVDGEEQGKRRRIGEGPSPSKRDWAEEEEEKKKVESEVQELKLEVERIEARLEKIKLGLEKLKPQGGPLIVSP